MGWIKRNLFFVIGVVAAVLLLAGAAVYTIGAIGTSSKNEDQLKEVYSTLANIKAGSDKQENIDAARHQAEQLREWIRSTKNYFVAVPSIPPAVNGLTDDAFATQLHRTITQLLRDADAGHVNLPPQYNFSFQAQSDKVRFAPPGSAEKLAVQLGEVKALADILIGAHVNAIEAIQRAKVSDDDAAGGADYIDDQPTTTDLATLTPYQITFRGFTDQIGNVLTGFGSSPHGFIIKSMNIQPADMSGSTDPMATPTPTPTGRGPQTVLDERMLRVTMMVEVIKLTGGK